MTRIILFAMSMILSGDRAFGAKLENADELLKLFGCVRSDLVDLPGIDLLIDDSVSMRGFVNSERGGRYRTVLDHFNESGIGDKVTILRLSAPRPDRQIKRVDSIFEPALYAKDDTPLESAFEFARRSPERITVLISDLEHSTTDGDKRAAETALVAALHEKKEVLLVGVRSAYSDQKSPHCSPNCSAQTYRYLYVLIMAKSPAMLRLFVQTSKIDEIAFSDEKAATHGWPVYYSTRPAVEVTGVQLMSDPARGAWEEFRETERVRCNDQSLGHVQSSFSYRGKWPTDPLRLLIKVTVHDPVDNVSSGVLQMSKIERPGSPFPHGVLTNGLWHSAIDQPFATDKAIRFEYRFKKPNHKTWDVYRIWFNAEPTTMEAPKWVRKWNEQAPATKDASPAVAALVRIIIRRVTKKEPILEHFIAIGPD